MQFFQRRRQSGFFAEQLENRTLLSTVSINAAAAVRTVNAAVLGVNVVPWDSYVDTTASEQMVEAAGLTGFRIGGGASTDGGNTTNSQGVVTQYGTTNGLHFNQSTGGTSYPAMALAVEAMGGDANTILTIDYGSGSPQEAAAMLAYFNASTTNTTSIGMGEQWNASTRTWIQVNWQTAGYWASLRAATPLAQNDGLNFMRLGQTAPFGFHFWEVGNEMYGSWETDNHGSGGDTGSFRSPTTYVAFAKTFAQLAASIDPSISIGFDAGSPASNDTNYNNWIPNVLAQCASQGLTPSALATMGFTSTQPLFLSDHNYIQQPGSESDSFLLQSSVSKTNQSNGSTATPTDWAQRTADYQNIISSKLGSSAVASVALLGTEFNSVSYNPGKQTTSLVNGLFVADSIGAMLETAYNGSWVWDLRNGFSSQYNNSSSLYGWRQGGDYGLLGINNNPPTSGPEIPYPTYFAEQLASKMIHNGDTVVSVGVSPADATLSVYAVLQAANGHLDLLVLNKNASTNLTEQFNLTGFQPGMQATMYQYGETQDTAQENSPSGAASLATTTPTLTLNGASFSMTFPAYSMSVIDLSPGPAVATAAAANPNPITSTTTSLTALGSEAGSTLTYTWSATGPASVGYSVNGSVAASSTVATFIEAGNYSFTVTIADSKNETNISTVNVTVVQTLTSITVAPSTMTVPDGQSQPFTASAWDQFNIPLAETFAWTLDSGSAGSIDTTGNYTAPPAGVGSATVRATAGSVSGTATVTVQLTTIAGTVGNDVIQLTNDGSTLSVYINNSSAPAYTAPFSSLGALTILGEGGDDQIILDSSAGSSPVPAAGLTIDATSAQLSFVGDSIGDSITLAAGDFTIPAWPSGSGIVPLVLTNLTISSSATLAIAAPPEAADRTVLMLGGFSNSGLLDLSANDMILHNGDLSAVTAEISQGFDGIIGITSSAANSITTLGVELNSSGGAPLMSAFDNQAVASTDVLIKYTYFGDANLDGIVNGDDYTLIDNGFNNGLAGWHNGDFNYDGAINGDDYTLIDNAFNTQGPALTAASALLTPAVRYIKEPNLLTLRTVNYISISPPQSSLITQPSTSSSFATSQLFPLFDYIPMTNSCNYGMLPQWM